MATLGSPLAFPLGGDEEGACDLTADEAAARAWLISLWPPGVRDLYDLDGCDADVANYFSGLAQAFTKFATGRVATLRSEAMPAKSTVAGKLPDWESALGILPKPAQDEPTRQAAVVSRLRESGSYDRPSLRALLGPLLGYADPSQIVFMECIRGLLTSEHTYPLFGGAVPPGGSLSRTVAIRQPSKVSAAGLRVRVEITTDDLSQISLYVTRSGGPIAKTWPAGWFGSGSVANLLLEARSLDFADDTVAGTWSVVVGNGGGNQAVVNFSDLFVEGAGLDSGFNGHGSQIYEWGPLKDKVLAGVANASDDQAVRAVLSRVKPAHTAAYLIYKSDDASGAAIPDNPESIPDGCYPGV
jgi:uncharacterized protein YmfQ (DUF2313 family)